jgi:hypothetical protein
VERDRGHVQVAKAPDGALQGKIGGSATRREGEQGAGRIAPAA